MSMKEITATNARTGEEAAFLVDDRGNLFGPAQQLADGSIEYRRAEREREISVSPLSWIALAVSLVTFVLVLA